MILKSLFLWSALFCTLPVLAMDPMSVQAAASCDLPAQLPTAKEGAQVLRSSSTDSVGSSSSSSTGSRSNLSNSAGSGSSSLVGSRSSSSRSSRELNLTPSNLRERMLATVTGELAWPEYDKQFPHEGNRHFNEEARFILRNGLDFPVNLFYTSQPVTRSGLPHYTITNLDQIQSQQTKELQSRVNYENGSIKCYFYVGHMLIELQNATTDEVLKRQIIEVCGKWLICAKEGQIFIEPDAQMIEQASQEKYAAALAAAATASDPANQKSSLRMLLERCCCRIQ